MVLVDSLPQVLGEMGKIYLGKRSQWTWRHDRSSKSWFRELSPSTTKLHFRYRYNSVEERGRRSILELIHRQSSLQKNTQSLLLHAFWWSVVVSSLQDDNFFIINNYFISQRRRRRRRRMNRFRRERERERERVGGDGLKSLLDWMGVREVEARVCRNVARWLGA